MILLGDIVEDARMAKDSEHDTIVRIGFMNENKGIHKREFTYKLKKYLEKFDVVISEDGSLCPVLHLLSQLSQGGDNEKQYGPFDLHQETRDNLNRINGFRSFDAAIRNMK